MTKTGYTATVEHDVATDEYYMVLSPELLASLGWTIGTKLEWTIGDDGSVGLRAISAEV